MEEVNKPSPETASPEDQTAATATAPIAVSDSARRSKGLRSVLVANIVVYMISAMILIMLHYPPNGGDIVVSLFFSFLVVILLDIVILPFALFMPSLHKYRKGFAGCAVVAVILALLGYLVITVLSGID